MISVLAFLVEKSEINWVAFYTILLAVMSMCLMLYSIIKIKEKYYKKKSEDGT
jgi:hypothetical protein